MEQFNKLPFPQKMAVLVCAMALFAGLFYYAMIIPIEEEAQNQRNQLQQIQGEVTKLQKDVAQYKDVDFKEQREELEAEKARFEQLLPPTEELPAFITGLSESAKAAGLQLISFVKGEPEKKHYYIEIPIEMEVKGTFRELIGFLRSVSDRDRRVTNIRDLKMIATDVNIIPILLKYGQERMARTPPGSSLKPLTPLQVFAQRVKAYEEALLSGVDLEVSFTALVFVYTGEKLEGDEARAIAARAEKIKERRQKKRGLVVQ